MNIDILATGSSGNAVVINDEILIDCGVSMKKLQESRYIKKLKLVLLTHWHLDHFNPSTVGRLHSERPILRFGMCEWMVHKAWDAGVSKRVIDVFEPGLLKTYDGGRLCIKPELLVHDVPNCAWKIHIYDPLCSEGDSLFYATDTGTLEGVSSYHYNTYLIEANHTQSEIAARIAEKQAAGEFAYEYRAAANHLSQEQALDWLAKNAGPNSKYVFLHAHLQEKTR